MQNPPPDANGINAVSWLSLVLTPVCLWLIDNWTWIVNEYVENMGCTEYLSCISLLLSNWNIYCYLLRRPSFRLLWLKFLPKITLRFFVANVWLLCSEKHHFLDVKSCQIWTSFQLVCRYKPIFVFTKKCGGWRKLPVSGSWCLVIFLVYCVFSSLFKNLLFMLSSKIGDLANKNSVKLSSCWRSPSISCCFVMYHTDLECQRLFSPQEPKMQ